MDDEFRGFTVPDPVPADLYDVYRFAHEAQQFVETVHSRLKDRIAFGRWHAGWDQKGGRDYFFGNVEARFRGQDAPCFFGFFHYRGPEPFQGSHWQVWRREHDTEPVVSVPLAQVVQEARDAFSSGALSDYVAERAQQVKESVGVR